MKLLLRCHCIDNGIVDIKWALANGIEGRELLTIMPGQNSAYIGQHYHHHAVAAIKLRFSLASRRRRGDFGQRLMPLLNKASPDIRRGAFDIIVGQGCRCSYYTANMPYHNRNTHIKISSSIRWWPRQYTASWRRRANLRRDIIDPIHYNWQASKKLRRTTMVCRVIIVFAHLKQYLSKWHSNSAGCSSIIKISRCWRIWQNSNNSKRVKSKSWDSMGTFIRVLDVGQPVQQPAVMGPLTS